MYCSPNNRNLVWIFLFPLDIPLCTQQSKNSLWMPSRSRRQTGRHLLTDLIVLSVARAASFIRNKVLLFDYSCILQKDTIRRKLPIMSFFPVNKLLHLNFSLPRRKSNSNQKTIHHSNKRLGSKLIYPYSYIRDQFPINSLNYSNNQSAVLKLFIY